MCDTTTENPYSYEKIEAIAKYLQTKTKIKPKIGLFCGTGLGNITTLLQNSVSFPYSEIPNFPVSTVQGHDGILHFGYIGTIPVVCMQGRFHYFEGYPLWKCVLPVRIMKFLGVSTLILSNAAGGINRSYEIGDIMLIKDHLNFLSFAGQNPLRGVNDERFGPRFVATNDAYDRDLLQIARATAKELKLSGVREGVYACVGGPTFETIAELRALKMLGADCVGMSTVHEVLAARHCGIRCFGFSLITNICPMEYEDEIVPNHQEILTVGKEKELDIVKFVERLFQKLSVIH